MALQGYPEHAKLEKVVDASQSIGEFLEWLGAEGFTICEREERRSGREAFWPTNHTAEELLARHFGIDLTKLSAEKKALLDVICGAPADSGPSE